MDEFQGRVESPGDLPTREPVGTKCLRKLGSHPADKRLQLVHTAACQTNVGGK